MKKVFNKIFSFNLLTLATISSSFCAFSCAKKQEEHDVDTKYKAILMQNEYMHFSLENPTMVKGEDWSSNILQPNSAFPIVSVDVKDPFNQPISFKFEPSEDRTAGQIIVYSVVSNIYIKISTSTENNIFYNSGIKNIYAGGTFDLEFLWWNNNKTIAGNRIIDSKIVWTQGIDFSSNLIQVADSQEEIIVSKHTPFFLSISVKSDAIFDTAGCALSVMFSYYLETDLTVRQIEIINDIPLSIGLPPNL